MAKGSWLHTAFYRLLFLVLFCSFLAFFVGLKSDQFWTDYRNVYAVIVLIYTWYVTILLFIGEVKKEKFPVYDNEKIAVLIPCYNEQPILLANCISSVLKAKGNKSVFVIDDGSKEGINKQRLEQVCQRFGVETYFFEQNKGKRHALYHAVKNMIQDHDYVVTIDSDTVLHEDALVKVVAPLKDMKVGASTGDVLLINEKQNMLTRMIGAYYWIGLNIFKKAQSSLGMVVCCSGCLAAYRTDVIKSVIEDFISQRFLGEQCTHSEDRHLTNLVLRKGYKVKYAPEAVSYTYTPSTVKGFLKQQQRWKRGYIREATYTLSYAWKKKPLLFFQILICEVTMPFFAFGLMMALIVTIIFSPTVFLHAILPSWILFMFIRYMPIIFYGKRKIPGLFVYMVFYEIFMYWQYIYALFTVKNKSWITR